MKRLFTETALRCPYGRMPDTYLVFDTETSGTDPYRDCVLQYGFCVVEKRKKVNRFAFIVKRPPHFVIAPAALKVHHIDQARIQKEGIEPEVRHARVAPSSAICCWISSSSRASSARIARGERCSTSSTTTSL